jgi:UTP-glucose-1-phosphate uridylyltransferase
LLLGDHLYNDVGCIAALVDAYERQPAKPCNILAVTEVEERKIKSYGVLKLAASSGQQQAADLVRVERVVEKPSAEEAHRLELLDESINLYWKVFAIYVISDDVMGNLAENERLGRFGKGGELQLTDALQQVISSGSSPFFALKMHRSKYITLDTGNPEEYCYTMRYLEDQWKQNKAAANASAAVPSTK